MIFTFLSSLTKKSAANKKAQRGSALVEMSLYLLVATLVQIGQIKQVREAVDSSIGKGTGEYLVQLQEGVNHFVLDNFTAISEGAGVAGFANPLKPTIAELLAAKYLIPTFQDQTAAGLKFVVNLTPANCPGLTCTINGQAYSTQPMKDPAGAIRPDMIAKIMQAAGKDSGASSTSVPATIRGFGGSWTAANPAGGVAGIVAMQVGTNSGTASQLSQFYKLDGSRKLTGTMDANQQNIHNVANLQASTSINVGAVESNPCVSLGQTGTVQVNCDGKINATTINSATVSTTGRVRAGEYLQLGATAAEGAGCASNDLVSRTAAGVILSCQSGIWAKSGGGIKDYAEFNWYPGGGTFGTGLPFDKWTCSLSMVGGKYAGGGEQIQVYRDGGSGTWIVAGSSSSDNSGAFARISCTQFG